MQQTTADAIRSILRADPSVSPAERTRLLALLRTGGAEPKPDTPAAPRLLPVAEVARRLGRTPRTVHHLAEAGHLHRIKFPGRVRAAGFLESEVNALMAGGVPAEDMGVAS